MDESESEGAIKRVPLIGLEKIISMDMRRKIIKTLATIFVFAAAFSLFSACGNDAESTLGDTFNDETAFERAVSYLAENYGEEFAPMEAEQCILDSQRSVLEPEKYYYLVQLPYAHGNGYIVKDVSRLIIIRVQIDRAGKYEADEYGADAVFGYTNPYGSSTTGKLPYAMTTVQAGEDVWFVVARIFDERYHAYCYDDLLSENDFGFVSLAVTGEPPSGDEVVVKIGDNTRGTQDDNKIIENEIFYLVDMSEEKIAENLRGKVFQLSSYHMASSLASVIYFTPEGNEYYWFCSDMDKESRIRAEYGAWDVKDGWMSTRTLKFVEWVDGRYDRATGSAGSRYELLDYNEILSKVNIEADHNFRAFRFAYDDDASGEEGFGFDLSGWRYYYCPAVADADYLEKYYQRYFSLLRG